MSGDWCKTWERAAHVIKLGKGWYRIQLYTLDKSATFMGIPHYKHLTAVYATNRRDANTKAKMLVSGAYDDKLEQPRLF